MCLTPYQSLVSHLTSKWHTIPEELLHGSSHSRLRLFRTFHQVLRTIHGSVTCQRCRRLRLGKETIDKHTFQVVNVLLQNYAIYKFIAESNVMVARYFQSSAMTVTQYTERSRQNSSDEGKFTMSLCWKICLRKHSISLSVTACKYTRIHFQRYPRRTWLDRRPHQEFSRKKLMHILSQGPTIFVARKNCYDMQDNSSAAVKSF